MTNSAAIAHSITGYFHLITGSLYERDRFVGTFDREVIAYSAFQRLVEQATECKRLFEDARLALPAPLARLLGEGVEPEDEVRAVIPFPMKLNRPVSASADWIFVPMKQAVETTLVRAFLGAAGGKWMTATAVYTAVAAYKSDVSKGTIANIGTRLAQEEFIERGEDGWRIRDGKPFAVIADEHLWGSHQLFEKSDAAAYRRAVIAHALRCMPAGLQPTQIVKTVQECCPWYVKQVPINVDVLKADLPTLESAGLSRRVGSKWMRTDE